MCYTDITNNFFIKLKGRGILMKKFLTCFVATLTVLGSSVPALAADNMSVYVNSQKVYYDVQPQTINGRIMVPMRATFSALGADVTYHKELGAISAQKGNDRVVMLLGEKRMGVFEISTNEAKKFVDSDVAPTVINGRTLIPLRAVSDCFDCDITWNNQTKSAYITFLDSNKSNYRSEKDDLVSPEQFDKNTALKQAYFNLACDIVRKELKYPNSAVFSNNYRVDKQEQKEAVSVADSLLEAVKQQGGTVSDEFLDLLETADFGEIEPYSTVMVNGYVTVQNGYGGMRQVSFYVSFDLDDRDVDYIMIDGEPIWHYETVNGKVKVSYPSYSLKGYYY